MDNILKNHAQMSSSIISFATQLAEISKEFTKIRVSHRHFASQSVLIALVLAKITNNNIDLVITDDSLLVGAQVLAKKSNEDKLSYAR